MGGGGVARAPPRSSQHLALPDAHTSKGRACGEAGRRWTSCFTARGCPAALAGWGRKLLALSACPHLRLVTPRQGAALGFLSSLLCPLKPLGAWLVSPAPGSAWTRVSLPVHPTPLLPFGRASWVSGLPCPCVTHGFAAGSGWQSSCLG